MTHPQGLVHVVDADEGVQQLLSGWLATAGLTTCAYAHLGAFLTAHRPDVPSCLVIDAQPSVICGLEPEVILLPLAVRLPIIVTTCQARLVAAARATKSAVIGCVQKPLQEGDVTAAVYAAIEMDRRQRVAASRKDEVLLRFRTLTPREREVMALVTTGRLNKQVGGHLGVSEITVKAHRGAAMRKMGARSLAELVRMADLLSVELAEPVRTGSSARVRSVAYGDRHNGYSPDRQR
jgi:FixJ family two-component response regulator